MFKKSNILLAAIAMASVFQACKKSDGEFDKTASGLEYKMYTQSGDGDYERRENVTVPDSTALAGRLGQIMTLRMEYRNSEDSVLFSTYERNMPVQIEVMDSPNKGGIEEAFLMLNPGDSAVFRVNADTLFNRTFQAPRPPFIKEGSFLTFNIVAVNLQSREAAMAEQETMMKQRYEEQLKTDEERIKAYASEQGLETQRTESGVYYTINEKGTGTQAESGKAVTVHYVGTSLAGKEFDSSRKEGAEPFTFTLGRGEVIPGWDEGIANLRKGDKAVLLIPSPLAYGERPLGPEIPANSILRFDVELLDVK